MLKNTRNNKPYSDLEVWKVAINICDIVYFFTKDFPKNELFGLVSQIRRSAISIASNISEGCGRNSSKDVLQFLFIARGSIYELETQIVIANNQKYLSNKLKIEIFSEINKCKYLLNGLIKYYQKPKLLST